MLKLLKRFLVAWKLARDPQLFETAKAVVAYNAQLATVAGVAKVGVATLLPEDRHAARKERDLVLNITCAEIMSPEEADRILEESRRDDSEFVEDVDAALRAHNDKFDRYSPK